MTEILYFGVIHYDRTMTIEIVTSFLFRGKVNLLFLQESGSISRKDIFLKVNRES